MYSRSALILTLFAAACSEPLAPGLEQPDPNQSRAVTPITLLAQLEAQQELVVRLHSEGCFHYLDAEVRFAVAAGVIEVSGKVWNRMVVEVIGPKVLSQPELDALDEELAAVRNAPSEGICTTTTTYDLTWHDGMGLSRAEHTEDHTCALFRKYWSADGLSRGPAASFTMLAGEALYRRFAAK